AESPTVPDYRYVVGLCYYTLADLLTSTERRTEAEAAYRQAARTAEELVADFPGWALSDFGGLFMRCHAALQALLLESGRAEEAEGVYLRAREINRRLARDWMKSRDGRWRLAEFRWGLASFARRYARHDEATHLLSEALSLYEQVAA